MFRMSFINKPDACLKKLVGKGSRGQLADLSSEMTFESFMVNC